MTVREAAEVLQLNESTVYALCSAGRLGHSRVGMRRGSGRIRISEADVAAFLRSCEVPPEGPATPRKAAAPRRPGPIDPELRRHLD
jgi:excisionase family DNA binding protein